MSVDVEAEEIQRRCRAGDESSDSDASVRPCEELASSHSSDDDEFFDHDVQGGWTKTSARPHDYRRHCCS